ENGKVVIKYAAKNLNYFDKEKKLRPINAKLNSSANGWAAPEQDFPTYLNSDGSTELTSKESKIKFNFNCRINDHQLNLSDYTVGEDGMYVNNAIPHVDKKIIFNENRIETDYIIKSPVTNAEEDLVISENIFLPEGYTIKKNTAEGNLNYPTDEYVVFSADDKEEARFKMPVFYDANKTFLTGKYELIKQDEGYILQFTVPHKWLNDPKRIYPVTIDPVVTGPTSNYPATYLGSCVMPAYMSDSMIVTIPANITITNFFVTDSYYADAIAGCFYSQGSMYLSTHCGNTPNYTVASPAGDSSGYAYLNHADLKSFLTCCFTPSCSVQTFELAHHIGRTTAYGPGCNQLYIYYSPFSPYPFSAYIVGNTVETAQTQWSLFPVSVCSDSCKVFLKATTKYGVPPYTMTHPWAAGPVIYGTAVGACNSIGTDTIALTIPGCPTTCGTTQTLSVPPPVIVDVCGNAVAGLSPKNITVKPVPVVAAASSEICAGTPININVSSCVPGSTFAWTADDGISGTGNINDNVSNSGTTPVTINYSVTPIANGCVGQTTTVQGVVYPNPIITASMDTTVQRGTSVQLNATGGVSYVWHPNTGLNCSTCANPVATPDQTTTYLVTGTNGYGCESNDTVTVDVIQGDEELFIPNSFTPDGNNLNDIFYVYGSSILSVEIRIYDRWGELVYHGTDQYKGWDGKFHGNFVQEGVYVYKVDCEFISTNWTHRTGIVTVLGKKE
ncbi:MAG: T9SS type B sorting domain-containing protein, partial [Bacteroidia bacterium]